ncbi:hypothetical protein AKJ09_00524 [Labilithrix luteola]|uniref:IgGFc-binding protein N-terminal domain-containing protein n=1 Tax=Labilithrix luteola TaxID=1391654 RepID=A0A0K1PK06_9BACT|nr:IgGFc-binding protein [Labilithrix luteola]AKU93860.1 hypothetical protein AKJ09_00524 [Labilithrix luteola]
MNHQSPKPTRPALRIFVAALGSVAALVLGSAACGSSDRTFAEESDAALLPVEAAAPDAIPSCEGLRCSRDLKKVVDGCSGEVIRECGPDEGCANGACVDACTAAEVSKGSAGCSFWTLPPDEPGHTAGSCFAAMVANTWDRPVTVTAHYGTDTLDLSQSIFTAEQAGSVTTYTKLDGPLPPGQVALVFLSEIRPAPPKLGWVQDFSRCPEGVVGALNADPIGHGTTITKAFSITTDAPVSAYSIYPYGGADTFYPTATLLLPTSAWDERYMAINGWPARRSGATLLGYPTLQIVAASDDTTIRMKPTADIPDTGDVKGAAAGQVVSWKLSRGQVLQITQPVELTGSPIEADKPIGLFGGSRCTYVPDNDIQACDDLQQQIPPISQWGNEYALVPYHGRLSTPQVDQRENVPYRLVGAVSGTVLTYDPQKPAAAPDTLQAGEVVSFLTDQTVVVRSQDADHPIYASVMMTGAQYLTGPNGVGVTNGDPDFVNVVPTDQYLDHYVFFADFTFPDTTLTVVRRKTNGAFLPVELDCVGEIKNFQPLGSKGEYEFAWVDLTKGFAAASGTCRAGRHEAKSDGPFTLSVWGTGYCASYGYAGGQGSRPLTTVDVGIH